MILKKLKSQFGFPALFLILISCNDPAESPALYSNGVFISCEGTFNASNASVSFYSYATDSLYNNIFKTANSRSLGDVAQSITVYENMAFIVVNNSNKIEVVNASDFREIATITEVSSPRYLVISNDKAYVSCWGDHSIAIIDLKSYEVIKRIPAGIGPEKMIVYDNKLFVANTNAYDYTLDDSTLTIIDMNRDELLTNINIGAYNPVDLELDRLGNLWVLCRGRMNWDSFDQTPSYLVKVNPEDLKVLASYELFADAHPANLSINPDRDRLLYGIFFLRSGIFEVSVDDPGQGELFLDIFPYGFDIHQEKGELFVTHAAADFVSNGTLERYSPEGNLLESYTSGINGNGIAVTIAE